MQHVHSLYCLLSKKHFGVAQSTVPLGALADDEQAAGWHLAGWDGLDSTFLVWDEYSALLADFNTQQFNEGRYSLLLSFSHSGVAYTYFQGGNCNLTVGLYAILFSLLCYKIPLMRSCAWSLRVSLAHFPPENPVLCNKGIISFSVPLSLCFRKRFLKAWL